MAGQRKTIAAIGLRVSLCLLASCAPEPMPGEAARLFARRYFAGHADSLLYAMAGETVRERMALENKSAVPDELPISADSVVGPDVAEFRFDLVSPGAQVLPGERRSFLLRLEKNQNRWVVMDYRYLNADE